MKAHRRNGPRALASAPALGRTHEALGAAAERFEPSGGRYGAGLLRGVAILTAHVEALGHDAWVDDVFARQIAAGLLAAPQGIKGRYTHPNLSADGLSRFLGRVTAPEGATDVSQVFSGRVVRGDFHFAPSARRTPDGDLVAYLESRWNEDPESLGLSVAFVIDHDAEARFIADHGGRDFRSPDPANVDHLPHARARRLRAADFVGDPAANPAGLFGTHAAADAAEVEGLLAYCLGQRPDAPPTTFSDFVAPSRVRGAVARYLQTAGLLLVPQNEGDPSMAKQTPKQSNPPANPPSDPPANPPSDPPANPPSDPPTNPPSDPPANPPSDPPTNPPANPPSDPPTNPPANPPSDPAAGARAELSAYMEAFGEADGARWFAEGREFSACFAECTRKLRDRVAELETQLAAAELGQTDPVGGGPAASSRGLSEFVRIRGRN